jgi:cysteine desulfurase / selenocysteine lyase
MQATAAAGTQALQGVADQFPILKRSLGGPPLCYLDSAATAQKPETVLDALDTGYRFHNANIHRSVYQIAEEATEAFEGARVQVANWIGAGSSKEVVFTRNATEAINLVAYSFGRSNVGAGDRIVLTEMEHHSNLVPWQLLASERGATLDYVPVDERGHLDLDAFDGLLKLGPKLVCVTHVSNVLGTVNPIFEVVRRAHDAGALVLVDGAQAVSHFPVNVAELGCDFYAFTGHKLYGPTGIGVLYGRREVLEQMPPFLAGGDMIRSVDWFDSSFKELPWKFEAGTSAFVEARGLGAAVGWLRDLGIENVHTHEADLVSYALERLGEVPGLTMYGPDARERGAVVSFSLAEVHPHDVAELLGRSNICIRAGHHCAQPLMRKLGVQATSRASFAVHNTRTDVDRLIEGLENVRRVFKLA